MTRPSLAMIALESKGPFSDYPIEDSQVRKMFRNANLTGKGQMDSARDLARDLLMRQNRSHTEAVNEFLKVMAQHYPNSGFERFGFTFFNTNSPVAIVLHHSADDSYAIGLDYGMMSLFAFTFPALLHARLQNLENLTWLTALVDIFQRQFLKPDENAEQREYNRLIQTHYLETPSSFALTMTFQFLIAHELAHTYLGHFKTKEGARVSGVGTGSETEEVCTYSHAQEYEADAWGAAALRQIAGSSPIEQTLARYTPSLYLGIFSLVKMLYVPDTPIGKHLQDSHPDPWDRAQRLLPTDPGEGEPADVMSQAVRDLPRLIATERENPAFQAAALHMKNRFPAAHDAMIRDSLRSRKAPWWKFWS
jgi:hypothetical protein